MKTKEFSFDFPPELIAQTPLPQRDKSKLLLCNAEQKIICDKNFSDIADILVEQFNLSKNNSKLLFVANNSSVYPARVRIQRKTGARGEVFFLEQGSKTSYSCLIRPKSKLKINEVLFADDSEIPLFKVESTNPPKISLIYRNEKSELIPLNILLEKFGEMPLPPYIQRDPKKCSNMSSIDKERYQTVYANYNNTGSCAAPTAGLHFTKEVIEKCEKQSLEFTYVTLHVGLGTFAPVQTENIFDHNMHEEYYFVSKETLNKICEYLEHGWPIIFVGTTSLRTIESIFKLAFDKQPIPFKELLAKKLLKDYLDPFSEKWLSTQLFIHPKKSNEENNINDRYDPYVGNALVTNFHQPESTLIMLVSALMGQTFCQKFYKHAIENKYRLFSYGDSSLLIFREKNI